MAVCMIRTCVWYILTRGFSISDFARFIGTSINPCLTSVGAWEVDGCVEILTKINTVSLLWARVHPGLVNFYARGHCRIACKQDKHNVFSAVKVVCR